MLSLIQLVVFLITLTSVCCHYEVNPLRSFKHERATVNLGISTIKVIASQSCKTATLIPCRTIHWAYFVPSRTKQKWRLAYCVLEWCWQAEQPRLGWPVGTARQCYWHQLKDTSTCQISGIKTTMVSIITCDYLNPVFFCSIAMSQTLTWIGALESSNFTL